MQSIPAQQTQGQAPVGQQQVKQQQGTGKMDATESPLEKPVQQQGKGKKEEGIQQEQQQPAQMQEVIWGMSFDKKDMELRDITCTLKMSEKLNSQQRFLLGNMFVEFADIATPEDVRNKHLPKWPMDHPWYQMGHVPLQEKRTFRFRALLDIFLKYILYFDEFKDYNDEIGVIDFVTILSDKVNTFYLKKSSVC